MVVLLLKHFLIKFPIILSSPSHLTISQRVPSEMEGLLRVSEKKYSIFLDVKKWRGRADN